ncbi:Alpha-(1,6)-fucosyltransferase [Nymphon striatum]|nr:Alpha-(1,6)-fucosyltransferase [Nymphon striatum]
MFSSRFVIKAVAVLLVFWIGIILIVTKSLLYSGEPEEHVMRRLTQALNDLDLLKRQNDELRNLIDDFKKTSNTQNKGEVLENLENKIQHANKILNKMEEPKSIYGRSEVPTQSQEVLHRLVYDDIKETMYYLRSEIRKIKKKLSSSFHPLVDSLESGVKERQIAALIDVEKLGETQSEWREKEAKELGDIIQKRITKLQNPANCNTARKLTCRLDKGCGYGCQIHHVLYCFLVAYGTERTLILKSHNWRYAKKGWESVFKPISDSCTDDYGKTSSPWPGTENTQVVSLPIVDGVNPRPKYLPLAIPADLSDRLIRLHGNPFVLWIGHFLKYLLRPQEHINRYLNESLTKLQFQHPIVGIHVRRTDKVGTEADFHGIEEYMEHVDEYYQKLEMTEDVPARRVYLATDDPTVLDQAKKQYPKYIFHGNSDIAKLASINKRYSDKSLLGVILDIHALSISDYLVCTFSSQVCRIAYEIMQTLHPDASQYFHSLDDIYYYGGQNAHNQVARYNHIGKNSNEISLQKGDIVGIAGNHWDGFSKGMNRQTKESGLYPSYKTVELVDIVQFPTYLDEET